MGDRSNFLPLSSSGSLIPYYFPVYASWNLNLLRTSPYESNNHAGSVTRTNFAVCSYWKFKPSRLVGSNCVSFLDSHNFTNKGNFLISEVEIQTRNYTILAAMLQKLSYFVAKVSTQPPRLECSYGKNLCG